MWAETITHSNELYESTTENLKEINAVKVQMTNTLKKIDGIDQQSFYSVDKENNKVTYDMDAVKAYLNTIKDKSWNSLKSWPRWAWTMAVQIALESLGYDVWKIDGQYWPDTWPAVARFQVRHWLKVDKNPWKNTITQILKELEGEKLLLNWASEEVSDETVDNNIINKIDISSLWQFTDNKFSFKEWLEKRKWGKNFINIGWQTYYEYKSGSSRSWYWYYNAGKSIYIWWFINGNYDWRWIKTWADWDKYEWDWKDDKKDWKWTYTWADWDKYEWERKADKKDWKWTYTWASKDKYEWDWKDWNITWQWTKTWANWNKYEWEWKNDRMIKWTYKIKTSGGKYEEYNVERKYNLLQIIDWQEAGKYLAPDKWEIYNGPNIKLEWHWEINENMWIKFFDGTKIESDKDWKKYIELGWKKYYEYKEWMTWLWYQSGIHSGHEWHLYIWWFENGQRNWQWTITRADWEKYEGEWKYGKRDWKWTYTRATWEKYEWEWKDGKRTWRWAMTWTNWNEYEWEFKDWLMHWKWTYTWADWDKHEGEWKDGNKIWKWKMIWANWNEYEWEWKDNKFVQWTFTVKSGDKNDVRNAVTKTSAVQSSPLPCQSIRHNIRCGR